ncbi:hypothetical protein [Sphingosinicella sp. BN140058]|uniref:DUF3617 domain-containing protein n=1 Tax=Sphingosinicella sp. BN140058 TaxID=1892855 RepID=UPI0010103A20|nr:hypothetical protein [Sphingosinicella sp. BN140058]QAY79606.1 hypothetical protein ETR14_25970 [Sphingosinicella sp. BN140058]
MMKTIVSLRRAALISTCALAAPALAVAAGGLTALAPLERGRWEVRDLDGGGPRPALCLGDPARLVQIEHPGPACPIEVLRSGNGEATAQYSCSGRGFGHTHIRVETPRLVRIDTQGLNNGKPFSYRLEAKKAGRC